jgi:hypothetical protein
LTGTDSGVDGGAVNRFAAPHRHLEIELAWGAVNRFTAPRLYDMIWFIFAAAYYYNNYEKSN